MSWRPENQPLPTIEVEKIQDFDTATFSRSGASHDENDIQGEKALIGHDSEVYDTVHIAEIDKNYLAIATNTEDLCILNLANDHCSFGTAHTQSILCLDKPDWDNRLLASGSKDNSIIIWQIKDLKNGINIAEDEGNGKEAGILVEPFAVAHGHTHSVASIAFSHSKNLPFLATVSHDTTLKLWPLSELIIKQEKEIDGDGTANGMARKCIKLTTATTIVAHSKDINSIDVSANDQLCVTASMDKTAKLWHIDRKKMELNIAGTLGGHKRGVWCARFAKNLQMVATCSGDSTIKIFSLLDNSCTRTLEGHQFAVLSLLFIDKSTKLVSVDGGGIMKIWNWQKGLCDKTVEGHEDKIWSLREMPPNTAGEEQMDTDKPRARFVTGSADGKFAIWEDKSEELKLQRHREQVKKVTDHQTLANLLQKDNYVEALILALDLNQPFQCLNILDKSKSKSNDDEGQEQLIQLIKRLNQVQLSTLLDYASQWNTNTRTYSTGQMVLNCVLKSMPPAEILKLPNIEQIIKSFLPYSIRHYERLKNFNKSAAHLDYAFSCMRLK